MTSGIRTLIYPVRDLARAKALYSKLSGVEPYMDEAYSPGHPDLLLAGDCPEILS